ncbi:MAG TPA: tRNA pseudouridine(38-40) synthase TruA [Ignavibacteriales bacterium]|nr:tRNA pseudouridine(38-40) synthase TruA [Ignavibacteriales bacterium]
MKNYKLIIQYVGSDYSGWQIQKNSASIQAKITDAIEILLKERVNLIGSGRTDSGVHAIGQVANFRTENEIDIYRFKYSLNSVLPGDIVIKEMEEVDPEFHSRFDAKKRTYLYLITQTKSPFYKNYSYFYPRIVNLQLLDNLSTLFLGENNFTSFSKKNTDIENKICTVYKLFWRRKNELILFSVQADRFLHGMVRTIVGTLLNAQSQNEPEAFIKKIFNSQNREDAFESVPAKGLFLYKVEY